MPVQAGNLYDLETLVIVVTAFNPERHPHEVDDPSRYVESVEAGHHEEYGPKLRCTKWVAPGPYAFVKDKLGPLERLHANEGGAEGCRGAD